MSGMASREIYPNAPVALVVVELRHPAAPPCSPDQEAQLKQLVAKEFPLAQPLPSFTLRVGLGPNPGPQIAPPAVEKPPRFTNRERTAAVTFRQEAVVVETTKHEGFHRLVQLVGLAVSARQRGAPVDGIERVGLRYIDEIRVPGDEEIDWSQWIHPSLLGAAPVAAPLGLKMVQHQAVQTFEIDANRGMNFQYGPRQGQAVQTGPLVRPEVSATSPFFLMDIDSFWMASGQVPEFDPDAIVATCEEVHDPVNAFFENLITERLRADVLR